MRYTSIHTPFKKRIRFAGLTGLILIGMFSAPVYANDREDVTRLAMRWITDVGKQDADIMVAMYSEDAILHGTVSPVLRQGPVAIREYFAGSARFDSLNMTYQQPMHIQMLGETAINTGYYSVTLVEDGKATTIPLRYSFVYHKTTDGWKIVNHHSSVMPEP